MNGYWSVSLACDVTSTFRLPYWICKVVTISRDLEATNHRQACLIRTALFVIGGKTRLEMEPKEFPYKEQM